MLLYPVTGEKIVKLGPDLSFIEVFLQFVGAFVSISIATVAFKGYRQTESQSLLRLATAFAFLGVGFLVEGVVGIGQATALFTSAVIAGLLLETTGYFFLAFSHAIDVTLARRTGIALLVFPVITLSTIQL